LKYYDFQRADSAPIAIRHPPWPHDQHGGVQGNARHEKKQRQAPGASPQQPARRLGMPHIV
jgi:hypothetical protein